VAEVILVRHATTSWTGRRYCGRSDPPLDRAGRAMAASLATELAPGLAGSTRIVSSPARRALATAAAIAAAAGLGPVEVDARWAEADVGIADGRTFAELERVAPALAAALAAGEADIDWPGGETAASLAERVGAAWHAVVATDRDTVVVSHGGPLRIALALVGAVAARDVDPIEPGAWVRRAPAALRP
jgi:broad specificity phosphatase PhoE